jgi:hypothetical protein
MPAVPAPTTRGDAVTAPPASGSEPGRRRTPTSTISLANARIPSDLPGQLNGDDLPASAPPLDAVDDEWADLERATRPPPSTGSDVPAAPLRIVSNRPPRLDLDDVDLGLDVPPRPAEPAGETPETEGAPTVRHPPVEGWGEEPAAIPVPEPVPPPDPEREMNDRLSLGDYSGALEIAERLLAENKDHAGARACAENCRTVLRQMYATRIGPLERVPIVMVPRDQLRWLSIDHRAGFVLSLVDGVSTLEMILDVSGMPELDTLRILSELAQQRIISLR